MRTKIIVTAIAIVLIVGGSTFAAVKVGWLTLPPFTDKQTPVVDTSLPSKPHKTAPGYNTSCPSSTVLGKRVPTLMVHGWGGTPAVWSVPTKLGIPMGTALREVSSIYPVAFEYTKIHNEWVTHPGIAPALSQKINCLARASKAGGGKGKVVIVAHSMGGLATKQALALNGAAKHVGLVITLGTPYQGSGWSVIADVPTNRKPCRWLNANTSSCIPRAYEGMNFSSGLLKALPKWPSNLGVMAIAGDVSLRAPTVDLLGDAIVLTTSAMAGGQRADLGGGELVYRCTGDAVAPLNASCAHGNLPHYRPIQEQVKRSIQRYIASLRGPSVKVGDMRLWLKPGWKINPEVSPGVGIEDTANCYQFDGQRQCPYIIIRDQAKSPRGSETYCGPLKLAGFRRVGSKMAEFYRNNCHDGPPNQPLLDWFVPGENVHIQSNNAPGLLAWLEKNTAWEE